ncbi:MAG: hypothetical protein K9N06_06465 [Candidatus Cloacimonetes bacterium]|nr:hypothetical protein [Candidatus Cloacimonadota bacterium]
MKIKVKLAVFLLVLLILSSCSLNNLSRQDKLITLQKNLALWKNFRLDGLASLNLAGLSFYKNITVINNEDSLKIILYEGGIFGSSPKPFARVTLADSLSLELPFPLPVNKMPDFSHEQLFAQSIGESDYNGIIASHELHNDKTRISFNDRYLITEISNNGTDFLMKIEYDFNDLPSMIRGFNEKKLLFQIEIDKFSVIDTINQEKT